MLGIPARYYSSIYILIVAVASLIVFGRYNTLSTNKRRGISSSIPLVAFAIFFTLFVGFRPIDKVFADMVGYASEWDLFKKNNFTFSFDVENLLFDNARSFLATSGFSYTFFFVLCACIYFGNMAWACSSLFPRDKTAAFLVYLGALSTFSYGTNGIKAGAAASLFLVALAMHEKRKWIWTLVFLLLSWGFHHSMVLPIVAFVVCVFVKNSKWYFALWAFCFIMALFHVTFFQELFARFADEQAVGYLSGSGETVKQELLGGFRIDFILYSAVPIFVGWIAVYKKQIASRKYKFLLNLYILINSVWMLCMYAEFTNRISYLSWLMLPIVLIYPFLKERWGSRQYKTFQWVAFGHLAFTLFMHYVYY